MNSLLVQTISNLEKEMKENRKEKRKILKTLQTRKLFHFDAKIKMNSHEFHFYFQMISNFKEEMKENRKEKRKIREKSNDHGEISQRNQ